MEVSAQLLAETKYFLLRLSYRCRLFFFLHLIQCEKEIFMVDLVAAYITIAVTSYHVPICLNKSEWSKFYISLGDFIVWVKDLL